MGLINREAFDEIVEGMTAQNAHQWSSEYEADGYLVKVVVKVAKKRLNTLNPDDPSHEHHEQPRKKARQAP